MSGFDELMEGAPDPLHLWCLQDACVREMRFHLLKGHYAMAWHLAQAIRERLSPLRLEHEAEVEKVEAKVARLGWRLDKAA